MISFRNENQNSAGNFNSVELNGVKFYFSYETCVVIWLRERFEGKYMRVLENTRGPTTGKHLSWVDWGDKDSRVGDEFFEKVLAEAYRQIGLK